MRAPAPIRLPPGVGPQSAAAAHASRPRLEGPARHAALSPLVAALAGMAWSDATDGIVRCAAIELGVLLDLDAGEPNPADSLAAVAEAVLNRVSALRLAAAGALADAGTGDAELALGIAERLRIAGQHRPDAFELARAIGWARAREPHRLAGKVGG